MKEHKKPNLMSFPAPFVRALENDRYNAGDSKFTVTGLISPPQRTWLAMHNEKHEDPYSKFLALLGTAVHKILEENVDESLGEFAERRMFMDVSMGGVDFKVSGQIDFYEPTTVFDYKITGGVVDRMKPEHYHQVQMNAYLAVKNGVRVDNVGVVYVQRDWSHLQSTLNPGYPQTPFKIFIHPYEEKEAIHDFGVTIADHFAASLGNPRECTADEQWAKPDTYALMKPLAKRASKVCASYAEAETEKKPGQFIQVRKGDRLYCDSFCGFGYCCPQHQKYLYEKSQEKSGDELL
jgi:hypothetical protein